jgi:hypothetical protein
MSSRETKSTNSQLNGRKIADANLMNSLMTASEPKNDFNLHLRGGGSRESSNLCPPPGPKPPLRDGSSP